ncbi:MAG: hypothetical protein ACE37B_03520 [Ilumatobacter sp.]|jgi:rod shape-determining protein MreD|uniref:hypothetical protein n=1 Tax=Ilumatobacter sp. TaxID=1967498 RepID=UPI00391971A6
MLAALFQSSLIRLVPVGMIALAIQSAVLVELQVAGVIIQLVLALAAAAGAAGGSERGAIAGFTLGMMFDLFQGTPLGSTAIAFTLAGVVSGLLALIVAEPQWWLAAIFVALGAAVGEAMVPVVRLFVSQSNPWPPDIATVIPVVSISAALLSPLLVPIARWCLRVRGSEWTAPVDEPL